MENLGWLLGRLCRFDVSGSGPPWPLQVWDDDTASWQEVGIVGGTGPAGLTERGAWSNSTAYAVNDWVSDNGSSYTCILPHTGHEPPNSTYWTLLASKGDTGATGPGGPNVDATTTTIGSVLIDQAPSSGHPIAVTTPRIGAANGVAQLDGSGHVLLSELSGITHSQLDAAADILATQIASLAASQITGTLGTAHGGTGLDTSGVTDGQLLIGRSSDHSLALGTLTAGTGIGVTNAGHAVTISNTALGAGGSLSTASASLGAGVSMPTNNTFYDGPSVSLAAGTWLVIAQAQFDASGADDCTAKLWDGTTVYASGDFTVPSNTYTGLIPLVALITLSTTTTIKISAAQNSGAGAALRANARNNSAGNNATNIVAVKIA